MSKDIHEQAVFGSPVAIKIIGVTAIAGGCASDEYVSRCPDTPVEIHESIKLWTFVSRNAQEHPYEHVVNRILSIVSIPASKASRERSFFRQKRITGHSRV
jgi:hypothetical protein